MDLVKDQIETDELVNAAKLNGEPSWFVNMRLHAAKQMNNLKMPLVQRFDYRDWRYTADAKLQWETSSLLNENVGQKSDSDISVVQVGQTTVQVKLPAELQQQGVILTDIFSAIKNYPDLVQKYLITKAITAEDNRLASYHLAYLNSGIFLYIPENVVIKEPIEAKLVQDSTKTNPFISHVLIVAEAGSEVAFTQHLTTQGEKQNEANCMVEILAAQDSQVKFSSVDELGANTLAYLERRAYVERNATVDWAMGILNEGNTIGDFNANLIGDGAQTDAKVIAISSHSQRLGINTGVTNRGKHSVGNILQRGVILEKSELVFNGIGNIIHGASGAKAEQENRILMMSSEAHGNANPILLIDENDVLAGHAASVGQVDQQQLYYLMSRGIDCETAERLVIRGFLGAVLSAIPAKAVRQQLIGTIERKLENGQ